MFCFSISDHKVVPQRTVSFKFRGGLKGPRPPFIGLLNISALHVQYGIEAFGKFKRPGNALDCISENFNLKIFSEEHVPEIP